MVRLIVTAPRGAMDSLVVQEASKNENIEVVGCVGRPGADYIGKDAGQVCGLGFDIGSPVYDSLEAEVNGTKLIDLCDVVADYSSLEMSMDVLEKCIAHGKGLLCGTTGFSDEQLAAFAKASESIPLMQTANTSYVVTVMKKLLREAAAMLESKAGMEIIEAHSDTKLDAPSGTAKELAQEMASGMKNKGYDDITFHSLRAGNTPSSHHVVFGCQGEMFQITHDAYDWRCYAIGACDAILYLGDRLAEGKTGSFTMYDVIEG
ncbi:MAG: 4-hydroxy-tetrahydrodipicolinate reductase [Bacillota bacterium]|nr:4-hydroxy-tetrahydrodipicolinate reductase [Bacillota bacterium]